MSFPSLPFRAPRALRTALACSLLALPGCAGWLLGVDDNEGDPAAEGGPATLPPDNQGACPPNRKLCGAACVRFSDPAYGCFDVACTPCLARGGAPLCTANGACGVGRCDKGRDDCDGLASTGCETETSSSPTHCGACGKACAGGEVCSQGRCASRCAASETTCGQSCIDTSASIDHCGTCNNPCAAPTSGTGSASCVAKQCKIACNHGYRLTADQKNCELIPTPTCGNGARDPGETCDDSNTANGDGCSSTCQAEPLYICSGAGPGSCVLTPARWAQQAYVKASNTHTDDSFGYSVALSADGSTLAVGADTEDSAATGVGGNQADRSTRYAGAVYIFKRTGSTWVQEAYLKASNTDKDDFFGHSVALGADGNTLAVGAFKEDSSASGVGGNQGNNGATDSGAVYVFRRTGSTWAQEAYLKASNTEAYQFFGSSVAISADGNTLTVAANSEDSAATGVNGNQADHSATASGAVYVFRRTGSTWAQEAYLKASNTQVEDYFGAAVALSGDGNTLAVGACWEDSAATGVGGNQADNSATDAGAVYVFKRTGSSWAQEAYLKASNTDPNDLFSSSVALSADGNTLAVAAKLEDSAATGVNGNQADNSETDSGAIYVFKRNGSTWAQEAYLKASNTDTNDQFGISVALNADGSTLAVGATGEDSSAKGVGGNQANNSAMDSGALYVFKRNGSTWAQESYFKASNTGAENLFGASVALSADGRTLVVGANLEESAATGVGGNQADNSAEAAGAVYVFTR